MPQPSNKMAENRASVPVDACVCGDARATGPYSARVGQLLGFIRNQLAEAVGKA
jgi:hypothetical protein